MELKRHFARDLEDGREETIQPVHNKQVNTKKQTVVSKRGQSDGK